MGEWHNVDACCISLDQVLFFARRAIQGHPLEGSGQEAKTLRRNKFLYSLSFISPVRDLLVTRPCFQSFGVGHLLEEKGHSGFGTLNSNSRPSPLSLITRAIFIAPTGSFKRKSRMCLFCSFYLECSHRSDVIRGIDSEKGRKARPVN